MEEISLAGGCNTTGIVRVGNTVRRPLKANSQFTHALLLHLAERGFFGAPRFLGIDDCNCECLSYIAGSVPARFSRLSDEQLEAAARLLRALHDATMDFALRGSYEVVCHGDASPFNCVFVEGLPVAFIDFDAAHPGARIDDLAYATWMWLDIGSKKIRPALQARRIRLFLSAYGIEANDLVSSIIAAQASLASCAGVPTRIREWAENCRSWTQLNRTALDG